MTAYRPLLSIVIPVFNLAEGLDKLFVQLKPILADNNQVVFVNDGSDDQSFAKLQKFTNRYKSKKAGEVILLQNKTNSGAGVSRDYGFKKATGKFTLFFDGDDQIHYDAVRATIKKMEETGANASLNRYAFIRDGDKHNSEMNVSDVELWNRYLGANEFLLTEVSDIAPIVEFTNYPWNKIIVTDHYKALDFDPFFGKTNVNNDILGHWNILLNAHTILLIDEVIVTHYVSSNHDHLSNKFGEERLQLFEALNSVRDILEGNKRFMERYSHIYWYFVVRVSGWAKQRIEPQFLNEFNYLSKELCYRINISELMRLRRGKHHTPLKWILKRIY